MFLASPSVFCFTVLPSVVFLSSPGNSETLRTRPKEAGIDVHARLHTFRKQHYVAQNMMLVVQARGMSNTSCYHVLCLPYPASYHAIIHMFAIPINHMFATPSYHTICLSYLVTTMLYVCRTHCPVTICLLYPVTMPHVCHTKLPCHMYAVPSYHAIRLPCSVTICLPYPVTICLPYPVAIPYVWRHGGTLVKMTPLDRRVIGSNPALAAL